MHHIKRWSFPVGGLLVAAGLFWWVLQDRAESGFGSFGLSLAGFLVMISEWVAKIRKPTGRDDLDEQCDLLAAAMRKQWTKVAVDRRLLHTPLPICWSRCVRSVVGPPEAATAKGDGQAAFDPLPGLEHVGSVDVADGTRGTLHAVYGGLPSGRLIITGPPASGKSAAAILLLLDALRYRESASNEDKRRIPVPVMLTVHNWDPKTTSVEAWLTAQLAEIPVFRRRTGLARDLLNNGHIAVFLDGLDEAAEHQRPAILEALADQATFRVVLTTRTDELALAASVRPLSGALALEVQPVSIAAAAEYLRAHLVEPTPVKWQAVFDMIADRPTRPLAQALHNPLTIALVRDLYVSSSRPVDELIDTERFPTREDIENHLLDHLLTTAYTPRLGQTRIPYSLDRAERTLTYIAQRLNQEGVRNITWWATTHWTPQPIQSIAAGLLAAATVGLVALQAFGTRIGLTIGLLIAVLVALFMALPYGNRVIDWPWRRTATMLAGWVPVGMLASWLASQDLKLPALVVFGGFLYVTTSFLGQQSTEDTNPREPLRSWREHVYAELQMTLGFVSAIAFFYIFIMRNITTGNVDELAVILLMILSLTLSVTAVERQLLSQTFLAIRGHTPWRLMRFLEDARSRQVLRTAGPTYQFRHAMLQDRIARRSHSPHNQ